ncbi:hypothetical protein VHEMI04462 [[Torrubiella] hemipterigena]|uniref:Oligopeptide transporter n=1 Tax=[Torrubiella] hemipterigena TaxID=1531966 RepID=A0A0A1SVB2_9HYPO|nr:hypothetical protein VHEMI04462 [[Torrubiella] hemipterigena]
MAPVIKGQSFTARGVAAGLLIGTVICAANVYFGLQTGWVSIMSMPASLMGFGLFRLLRKHIELPFSPVENVLVQSVACGMAIMPLGCGFVGVIPAMNYLLKPEEMGPIQLSTWQMIIWSLGLCYFGVVFAVPLRTQVIIREKLKFPSGFSTAVLISVLHADGDHATKKQLDAASDGNFASLVPDDDDIDVDQPAETVGDEIEPPNNPTSNQEWAQNLKLLVLCFAISGICTVLTYFFPVLRDLPVFGAVAAQSWLWTFNPSLAYVGQGIIMGTETTMHMLLGAVVGWAVLSPLAKSQGWAPGPVGDFEKGSQGWIIWISLAIMLVDAVISLAYIAMKPLLTRTTLPNTQSRIVELYHRFTGQTMATSEHGYEPVDTDDNDGSLNGVVMDVSDAAGEDAPRAQRIGPATVGIGLATSIGVCIIATHYVFGDLVPLYATIIAVLMALLLSIMGVRALGETDLNPVSGISKLAQLFFAFVIPQSNKSSVLINLIAGAISEAGALQAGDLMQDLKTGHLLGASPKAQFYGQLIGATCGSVLSAFIYQLYTTIYEIPGNLFKVPTAYVWIFTARLVTGKGLPPMAKEWAIGSAVLFACITIARAMSTGHRWRKFLPGGIAVAVGMYNVPSFTLARAVGGIAAYVWTQRLKNSTTPLIILASGFILGEGFLSIVNLFMTGFGVPHF